MERLSHDGLTFDVTDRGPADGEVVVLLHGWPQDQHAWDLVVPSLIAAGLRTLTIDLRGYSPGARPMRWEDYRIRVLVEDVAALIAASGAAQVHLVGHDWGGALAWAVASRHPERLASLTVLSTPHPRAMAWAMQHADQGRRSAYMAVLALPVLPALALRVVAGPALRRLGLPRQDAARYAARLRRPRAATASLLWYRAAARGVRGASTGPASGRDEAKGASLASETKRPTSSSVPTTYVWGSDDPAFGRAAAERTAALLAERPGARYVELGAGHWLPETRPAEVVEAVLEGVGRADAR